MALIPCMPHWRPDEMRHTTPAIEVYRGVLYHPLTDRQMDVGPLYGVYDAAGAPVGAAPITAGPAVHRWGRARRRTSRPRSRTRITRCCYVAASLSTISAISY